MTSPARAAGGCGEGEDMREIKFRVWDIENKEWLVYKQALVGWQCPIDAPHRQVIMWVYASPDEVSFNELQHCIDHPEAFAVSQFTGLSDRLGKEIYEGDTLRFSHEGEEFHTGPVSWREEFSIWGSAIMLTQIEPEDLWVKEAEYEVIGNIYESPKLVAT